MPEPGHVLVSADYSQIELRILAHMADIGRSRRRSPRTSTSTRSPPRRCSACRWPRWARDLRRSAKTINYGIVYGIGAFGLAQRLGIPQAQAKDYIDSYFEQYPGIRDYMDQAKAEAREQGLRHHPLRPPLLRPRDQRQDPLAPRLCRARRRSTPRSRARPPTS